MKERIIEFLRSENKSSALFAEEIGVQPSGVSHILSGRNNPSLDFVLKMLEKYKFISSDWLLFGKGTMYKDQGMRSLFDENYITGELDFNKKPVDVGQPSDNPADIPVKNIIKPVTSGGSPSLSRIVMFYSDNSFEEFFPKQ